MKDYLSDVGFKVIGDMKVLSGKKVSYEPEMEIIEEMNDYAKEMALTPTRAFGFDAPVSPYEKMQGKRGYEYWLVSRVISGNHFPYLVKYVSAYRYATLRIKEPFKKEEERIKEGWNELARWVDEKGMVCEECDHECLEELLEIDGITYMDIFLPVQKV